MDKSELSKLGAKFSRSEEKGISLLTGDDLLVFCPGISTGGFAEIRMALDNPGRKIIATTIDKEGIGKTKEILEKAGVGHQVEVRCEDVTKPMRYDDNSFDFIYARLLLHYLSRPDLDAALKEFYRILKPCGRVFIVVRSNDDWEANLDGSVYDEDTSLTTYPVYDSNLKKTDKTVARYFHSISTISSHLKEVGFQTLNVDEYKEQIYYGYMRTVPVPKLSSLIEIVAQK